MRITLKLLLILLLLSSCITQQQEAYNVLSTKYHEIPKILPQLPSNTDFSKKADTIHFKYAIHDFFVSDTSFLKFQNKTFYKNKKEGLFPDYQEITDKELKLIKQLGTFKTDSPLNKELLSQHLKKDNIVYLKKRFIDKHSIEKYDLTGIVSFSNVVFNKNKNKAALAVGIHRGKLDASYTVYILGKKNNIWKTIYYKALEKS